LSVIIVCLSGLILINFRLPIGSGSGCLSGLSITGLSGLAWAQCPSGSLGPGSSASLGLLTVWVSLGSVNGSVCRPLGLGPSTGLSVNTGLATFHCRPSINWVIVFITGSFGYWVRPSTTTGSAWVTGSLGLLNCLSGSVWVIGWVCHQLSNNWVTTGSMAFNYWVQQLGPVRLQYWVWAWLLSHRQLPVHWAGLPSGLGWACLARQSVICLAWPSGLGLSVNCPIISQQLVIQYWVTVHWVHCPLGLGQWVIGSVWPLGWVAWSLPQLGCPSMGLAGHWVQYWVINGSVFNN